MNSTTPTVFVFERTAYWTPELQRQFANEMIRVRQCVWGQDLQELVLAAFQANVPQVVVWDTTDSAAQCLQFLANKQKRQLEVPVLVFATAEAAELEWVLRDAGATDVFVEIVTGEKLAALCRRLLKQS